MVRKCATLAFGLALIVALAFGLARMHGLKASGGAAAFSAPCEPASPAFDAAAKSNAVTTLDSRLGLENTATCTQTRQAFRAKTATQPLRQVAPRSFPPLLHRPPPANS